MKLVRVVLAALCATLLWASGSAFAVPAPGPAPKSPLVLSPASGALGEARVGESFDVQLQTSGGAGGYLYYVSEGELPTGLALDTNTGRLEGMLTGAGTYRFVVAAQDSAGKLVKNEFSFIVAAVPDPVVTGSITASANPSRAGDMIDYAVSYGLQRGDPSASVADLGAASDARVSGTVAFYVGGQKIGEAELKDGRASLAYTALQPGEFIVTARLTPAAGRAYQSANDPELLQIVEKDISGSVDLSAVQANASRLAAETSVEAIADAAAAANDAAFSGADTVSANGSTLALDIATGSAGARALGVSAFNARHQARPVRLWTRVSMTGWDTAAVTGDYSGTQTNWLAGVTARSTDSFAAGVYGGYERFSYKSGSLDGAQLSGHGWTGGAHAAARLNDLGQIEGYAAVTGLNYDVFANDAAGSFNAIRFAAGASAKGRADISGVTLLPSLSASAAWERQSAWQDSLGEDHAAASFAIGTVKASLRAEKTMHADALSVTPYAVASIGWNVSGGDIGAAMKQLDGLALRGEAGVALRSARGIDFDLNASVSRHAGRAIETSAAARLSLRF